MKHLILFLCLTGTANADWEYVKGIDNTDFFFDVQTVRPTKHGVRYWSMSSNRTPEVFWNTTVGSTTTLDRKSTRLNSSHIPLSRMPSSA